MDPTALAALEAGFSHLNANKYYFVASTTMLLYDHFLTLDAEITYIWRKRFTMPTYIFFIFRYITPLVCILDLFAQHDPKWVGVRCKNWVWVDVAMAPLVSAATGIILILRIYALYDRSFWILCIIASIYLGQLGVMGWAMPAGVPAQLPPGFVGCIPSAKPGSGNRLSAINVAMLVFDAMVFVLTLGRSIYLRVRNSRLNIIPLVARDGIMYFFVLFVVNLANAFLLPLAPPDLSAINSPFATIVAATLVARLMLNLRQASAANVYISDHLYNGTNSMMRPDVGKWVVGQRTFSETVMGMSDFAGQRDWEDSTGTSTSMGSWTTAQRGSTGPAHQREMEFELENRADLPQEN